MPRARQRGLRPAAYRNPLRRLCRHLSQGRGGRFGWGFACFAPTYGKVCDTVSVVGAYPRRAGVQFCLDVVNLRRGSVAFLRSEPPTLILRIVEPSPCAKCNTREASSQTYAVVFSFALLFFFAKKKRAKKRFFLFLSLPRSAGEYRALRGFRARRSRLARGHFPPLPLLPARKKLLIRLLPTAKSTCPHRGRLTNTPKINFSNNFEFILRGAPIYDRII